MCVSNQYDFLFFIIARLGTHSVPGWEPLHTLCSATKTTELLHGFGLLLFTYFGNILKRTAEQPQLTRVGLQRILLKIF